MWTGHGAIGVEVFRTKVSGVDVLGEVMAREGMEEEVHGGAQGSSSSSSIGLEGLFVGHSAI